MATQFHSTTAVPDSASCLNNLKHGAAASSLFLKDEDPREFFALLDDAFARYKPSNTQASGLVARCVEDRWILLRRDRTASRFEFSLHQRKPDPSSWAKDDLHTLDLFDRYKTKAARAHSRSLRDLLFLEKSVQSEEHWQAQHKLQREKYELECQKFEFRKEVWLQKNAPPAQQEPQKAPPQPEAPKQKEKGFAPMFGQTVVISYEDGITTTLDVSPSNEELSGILQSIDCVFRTYHFLGGVPPAYEHLMTDDAERGDEGAIVSKYFTFDQWHALIATESFEQPLATAAAR